MKLLFWRRKTLKMNGAEEEVEEAQAVTTMRRMKRKKEDIGNGERAGHATDDALVATTYVFVVEVRAKGWWAKAAAHDRTMDEDTLLLLQEEAEEEACQQQQTQAAMDVAVDGGERLAMNRNGTRRICAAEVAIVAEPFADACHMHRRRLCWLALIVGVVPLHPFAFVSIKFPPNFDLPPLLLSTDHVIPSS